MSKIIFKSIGQFVIAGIFLLCSRNSVAQETPIFQWAKQTARGTGDEYSTDVTTDAAGNVFSVGASTATADYDPGAGTFSLINANVFISKLDASGNFLWAKGIAAAGVPGGQGSGIVTDSNGNVYVTGVFTSTVDFDPGPSVFNLTSSGTRDLYVLKLDGNGNFVWARNFNPDYGNSIAYDPAGFVYVTASSSPSSQCSVIKLDVAGNTIWTRTATGGQTGGASVSVDPTGNVVATGWLTGTADFDPGTGTLNLTAPGIETGLFIWKLNGTGDLVLAKQLPRGSISSLALFNSGSSLDAAGNIYLSSSFFGTQDFDPGVGTFTLSSASGNMFVCKLDGLGNFLWAKNIGTSICNFISSDASGNSYITGSFTGTTDFDPGAGVFNLTSAGNGETFILKLNASGNFVWATRTGSPSDDEGTAIHADASGNVYLTSYFYQFADFDPTCGSQVLTSGGNGDAYIQKLSSALTPTITSFSPITGSSGTTVTITGVGFSTTPANNTVRFFNGIIATITASTATSITVTAPAGIATGRIRVTVGCITATSTTDFVIPPCIDKLFDFTGVTNGESPRGSLFSDGTFLYGTTSEGGINNLGTIFKIKPDGTGYIKLLDFAGSTNGASPEGSLISDGSFLYGMTETGGTNNLGVIFKIKPDGTGFVKLLDFAGVTNGRGPQGSLLLDGTSLYGMTAFGGTNNLGTIFKIMTDGTGYVKLLDFASVANGSFPLGSLIYDGTYLYGMAQSGGTFDIGTVFKIRPDGTGFVKLMNFTGVANGSGPTGDLVFDGTFLYGMALVGGTANDGTIFKIRTDGTGFAKLLDFNSNVNGERPFGSFIYDGTSLYGMTLFGIGSAEGTLFKINTDGSAHTVLCNFANYIAGSRPYGSVISEGGFLYGMANQGGTNDTGVIFRYAIGVSVPTIASFTPTSGPVGTTVTITGTNFSNTTANNIIQFNGTTAVVTASTTTSIITSVPIGATTGTISVSVGGNTATSAANFTVTTASSLTITSFTPTSGLVNAPVTITGTNFSTTPANNTVQFNGTTAVVSASTATSITTTVPTGATTGKITVTVAGNTATSASDFTVETFANEPPIIQPTTTAVPIDGIITIDLLTLISDPDGNLDVSTLSLVSSITDEGASATLVGNTVLELNYDNVVFAGTDRISISVCDLLSACTVQELSIEVSGEIEIYNAISPNNDNKNEIFRIANIDSLEPENTVTIYNRWGSKVFEVENYNNDDRVFKGLNDNGGELPSGTYFYKIVFPSTQEKEKTGYLVLKR